MKRITAGAMLMASETIDLEEILRRRQQKVREAAVSMIERYGQTALQQIDQRIGELRKHGADETVLLWREIRGAVKCLLDTKTQGKS